MSTQLDALRDFVSARPGTQPPRHWTNVLVVAGGKGGVGTSTVAMLLAAAAARQGRETLLVDAAGPGATLEHLLGVERPSDDDAGDGGPRRLAPRLALATPAAVGAGHAERALRYRRAAADFAGYDSVIVDAGASLEAVVLAAGAAGRLLAVTAHDRLSVAAAYALLKVVGQRNGGLPLGVLSNRCDAAAGAAAWERIAAGTERFLGHALGFAGSIPDDPTLGAAIEAGRALDATIHGAAALAADDVVGRTLAESGARRSLSLIRM